MKINKQFFKKYKKKTTKFLKWFFIDVVLERILYDLDLIRLHPTKKLRVDAVTKAYKVGAFTFIAKLKLPLLRRTKLGFKENPQIALILLASAFCPQISLLALPLFFGGVSYGNTTSHDIAAGGTTISYSHTATTGDDVVVITGATTPGNGAASPTNATATYGGAGMTREIQIGGAYNDRYSVLFSKANPASGSQTVLVTYGGNCQRRGSFTISFTGGRTSNVVGAKVSEDVSGYPLINITTTVDNSIIVDCVIGEGVSGYSPDGSQVQRWMKVWAGQDSAFASTLQTTTAGVHSMGWTLDVPHAMTVVEVLSAIVVIPTVTTQAVDQIEKTTARGNGNITATGGENCTRRGFCYIVGTSGDPTTANSVAYDDGDFGTGAYTKAITGLTKGTSYRVRAYAVNSAGTGYGTTVQIKTKTDYKIQKSLKYTVVQAPSAVTKSLKYTVPTTPAKIEKSLKYNIFLGATKIEKTLKYVVIATPSAITKSLKYTVLTIPTALTKDLEYIVNPPPPQEILSGKVVVLSDSTTATTPEDIDGLSFNITLKNEGYIMAFMSLTPDTGASDKKLGYFLININGVDSPVIIRYHYANKDGNVEVVFRSGLLPAGNYTVKGRHYTEAGVTLVSKNITLVAFPTEDEGGNRIKSIYDTIVSDSVVGSTVEDIDGLTQDITTEVLSFIFGMVTGSVSSNVKDKLYRLLLCINGSEMEVDRFLDSVDDIVSIGLACRTQIPETAGVINIKGRHAIEAGATGTIAPAILVGLDLSTISGGIGYVIPSGAKCIEGATISTISVVLEDMPTVDTQVTLTQEAHIFAVMTLEMESEKSAIDNFFAIRIGTVDFEEHGRTSNVKLDKAVITIVARTTTKLAAGTYTIKGRWRTESGNTLRAINDLSLVAIGLETTTQDLPTHMFRSLDYKIASTKSVTKDLKYTIVTTPTAKTKGLIYNVKTITGITKQLIYKAVSADSITKLLKYCVPSTPSAKTKSLKYNIFLGSTKIEKGLDYKVALSIKIEKSLRYVVPTPVKIQKDLKYTVPTTPAAKTKSLKYNIFLGATAIQKSLEYMVVAPASAIQKSLEYMVVAPASAIQKSLKYTLEATPSAITKDLKYTVVITPSAIEKSLKYTVVESPAALTKSLKYCVTSTPSAKQKDLKYTTAPTKLTPKGYCSVVQIQNYLLHTIKDYFKPQVLEWIAMMEKHVERETGRVFIADNLASEKIYDGDGKRSLFLDECVVISKLTIDGTEVSSSDYLLYPASELPTTRIKLKIDSGLFFATDEQNVKVEARWGHSLVCPADISFATMILVVGIINFAGEMSGEIKSEKIGDYAVTYKNQKDWQDFERAKEILKKNKLIIIG